MDENTSVEELKKLVAKFCEDRDWDQFHDPKELTIGMSTEANELLQIFRFKTKEQMIDLMKSSKKQEVEDELSDVVYFALRFAQMYNIDLSSAIKRKIEKNSQKYPINRVKGCNKKYNEYEE